jgi:Flp pilus assembly protein TadD
VIESSSLNNFSADSCVRRAVAGLTLPPPELFGARPGRYARTFDYTINYALPPRRGCPPTSRLDREARLILWRERLANNPANSPSVWQTAMARCELRVWEDRAALLDLIVQTASDPAEMAALRALLDDDATKYFERGVVRRWGPSRTWRAYQATQGVINWDPLMQRLAQPTADRAELNRRIDLVQAYLQLVPHDVDLRLRLLSLYELAGRGREARRLADELRADPYSDARVRALIGEVLIRAGDRDEGLRAFSEIAEFAPYDTNARGRLGDLLLTYCDRAWAAEAYLQYQTLAALRPGDATARVRMAIAAAVAEREDEALRLLRGVAEDVGADQTTPAVEALLVSEVARMNAARGDDPAVQTWTRIARLMRLAREGGVVARWSNPEVGLELRAQQSGDNGFVGVGEFGSDRKSVV